MKKLRELFRLPFLPVWAAALLLLAPVYLAGKAIFWGASLLQFGPWWVQAWESVFSGRLPLWNPRLGMGAPLLANYQTGLLYPPYWIYGLLYALGGGRGVGWGMAPVAALHLAWSGLGMALLARRLNLNPTAQAVAGLAYGLSGYLVARLSFLSINAAAAWLPWVLLCLTPAPGGPLVDRRRFPGLAACAALLLLAGHAQTAWYVLLLGGLWCAFWAWRQPGGWRARLSGTVRAWAFYGLALLLAAGIAAAQLLPTAEYLAQSQRAAAVEFDYALNYSFWPWRLLTLLAPGTFGSPASGDYWGYANIWEDAVYVGLLPLLLAFAALLGSLRRRADRPPRALVWFLAALFVAALLLALGKFTPLYPWLYRHVPTFDMFQAPARWMLWGVFSLALLAALGAEGWRRPRGWGLYWARLGTMGAAAVSLGAGLAWLYLGQVSPSFIRATAVLGLLGVGAGVLSLSAPPTAEAQAGGAAPGRRGFLIQLAPPVERPRPPHKPYRLARWQWAVALFVAADLLIAGGGLNPGEALDLYAPSPAAEEIRAQVGAGRLYFPAHEEDWLKYDRFMRFETFDPGEDWLNLRRVLLPNTNLLDGVAVVNNFDPFVPGRYAAWLEMLEQASPQARQRMLGLMDIGAVAARDRFAPAGVRFQSAARAWAWFVPCAELVNTPEEARQRVLSGEVNFGEAVVIESAAGGSGRACPPNSPLEAEVEQIERSPGRYALDLNLPAPGWLALSEVWYPGWTARLDGAPTPLARANYLFQAVPVPAGQHTLELRYRPLSFYGGAALSLAGLALLWVVWKRTRRAHG